MNEARSGTSPSTLLAAIVAISLASTSACSSDQNDTLLDPVIPSAHGAAPGAPNDGVVVVGVANDAGVVTTDATAGHDTGQDVNSLATPPPSAGLPLDDLAAAQAFVAPLVLGVNIERGWAWDLPGANATSSTQYWSYLKTAAGITHVRLFYPWRPSLAMGGGGANNAPPDQAQFDRILDAATQAIAAGLTVLVDCTDVMGTEDFTGANGQATDVHIDHCATWTAARHFAPDKFAIGPVNEWAGGDDNTTYNALRQKYHATLRAKLPGYVLTTGPGYWKSRDWLYDPSKKFETFADKRVLYEWHHYSSLDGPGWASEAAKLEAWRNANGGVPTICGEAGPGYWDEDVGGGERLASAPASWPSRFAAMLPSIAKERPVIWTITYGGDFRINKSDTDPAILDGVGGGPNLLQSLTTNAAAMRTVLGL